MTPNKPPQRVMTPEQLKALLTNGLDAVEYVWDLIRLDNLPYKIVSHEGQFILVDCVVGAEQWLKKFITSDKEMLVMKDDAMKLAKTSDEVLITGETGTGKELIARAMIGDRIGLFKRINCAAMPESLIESELFGHDRGAFTGAVGAKAGMMEEAKNGVLFLDEVGDLPLMVQAKLLNALQPIDGKRYIRRVGSNEEREITCRFVCATHKDIKKMVNDGMFRKDLYARMSTFELHLSPLRERVGDMLPIVEEIGEQLKIKQKVGEFWSKYGSDITNGKIGTDLNVRSLEKMLKRYNVLGKI